MIVLVDTHSGVPVYRQIMDQVRFQVASGLLAPGKELPSTRGLAADLQVNPMTVSKAYHLLERDGVLARRPGLPLVVAATDADQAEADRLKQVEDELSAVVSRIRQLGVDADTASAVLRRLLNHSPGDGRHD